MSTAFQTACGLIDSQKAQDDRLVLFVVGPTGSGKTKFAVEIAQKYGGEIISLDSRQFYRGFDIGTDKICSEEMQGVAHHLIDIADGDEVVTLVDVVLHALTAIDDCLGRGVLPICIGGTGLYTDALCRQYDDFNDVNSTDLTRIRDLRSRIGTYGTLELALDVPRERLYEKINARVDVMFDRGLVDEVSGLMEKYDISLPSMTGIGYRQVVWYLQGLITLDECKYMIQRDSRRYAKRQFTWFRHHGDVHWL